MVPSLRFPSWAVSPEEFRITFKTLLGLHYSSSGTFDRSWTVRYAGDDRRDLLVEVTHLLPLGSGAVSAPSSDDESALPPGDGFERMLKDLLAKAQDGGMSFDRSWRFQYVDADRLDLLVEVTYLEKVAAHR